MIVGDVFILVHLRLIHFFAVAIRVFNVIELGVIVVFCDGAFEGVSAEFLFDLGSIGIDIVGGVVVSVEHPWRLPSRYVGVQ